MWVTFLSLASAQHLSRHYHDRSMSDVLIDLDKASARYKVSYVGYKTISRLVNVGRIGTIRMQADAYQLKRVMVKGNLRTDRGDHATYTFNEEQVKNSRHTQDLIANIPGIIIDPVTGKTRSIVNKKMKILINDVAMTSDNDLKSIPAEKIKKVEYYDAPPARYGDVDILVNIITKPLDTGYWLFNDAKYRFETIDNPILSRKEWHTIKDNNRMVSIGVSWNFFSGKKKDIQKNINNRDADSGAFK